VRGNVRPTTSLFVVPNNPEPGELQAALNVLGGLGSLTGSDFIFEMVTANQLTEELITNSNIIFIGKPENLEILSSIQFPMLVENGQFDSPSIDLIDEGVIQLAASPWNPNKSVLLVSGKTTDSVNKAANAISTGRLFITGPSDLAFIADVQTEIDKYSIVERFRLKDLGYSTVTLSNGLGFTSSSNETSYSFFLPKEQIASEGGSIELVYYTGRVVINESSISVSLNDKKIAAIILDESTSGSLKTYKIDIPPGLLRFGENQLDIVVDLIPIYSCDTLGLPDYFIAVHENTLINIPVALDKTGEDLPLDFRMYPGHFIDSTDLSNVAFILSQGDPLGWNVASKIAFDLGRLGDPLLSNMAVAYSDAVSEEIRQGNDLIVVGRASKSPFLAEMNDHLPAPFNLETDAANEKGLQVTYITPPGVNLGYLELLNSPFNQDNEVLVISGNTDDGMILAGRAITETGLRRELMGLFAITNGSQIATSRVLTPFGFNENQGSITATLVPSAVPYVTTPIPTIPGGTTPSMTQPNWLTPILIASLVIILIIIVRQVVISRK
jgi:hypothetical protein